MFIELMIDLFNEKSSLIPSGSWQFDELINERLISNADFECKCIDSNSVAALYNSEESAHTRLRSDPCFYRK
jgi:hypothetical protein